MSTIARRLIEHNQTSFDPLTSISWGHAGWADDPLWTTGQVTDGMILNGASNAYASSPDSVPLRIAGDITIVVHLTMVDWSPASFSSLVAKYTNANGARGYVLQVLASGALTFVYSPAGSTAFSRNSTVATGFGDGVEKWVAVTFDADNGASGNTTKFWTSNDGITWTQLGSDVVVAGVATIFATTTPLNIGSDSGGSANRTSATFHKVKIWDGLRNLNAGTGGTLVFDADFSGKAAQTSFIESSSNAATVTLGSLARMGIGVTSWRNSRGSDHPILAQSRPTLEPNLLNGKRGVVFNGASALGLNVPSATYNQVYTMVAIGRTTNTADTGAGAGQTMFGNGSVGLIWRRASPSEYAFNAGATLGSGVTPDTNAHLGIAVANSTSTKILFDGTLNITGDAGVGSFTQIGLGCRGAVGDIGRLLGQMFFWGIINGDFTANPNYAAFKAWVTSYYGIVTT